MKKFSMGIVAIAGIILVSCAGAEKKIDAMKKYRQVAIVDVSANNIIYWEGEKKKEGSAAGDLKIIGKLTGSKKLEETAGSVEDTMNDTPKDIIDEASAIIEKNLIGSGSFKVLPFASFEKEKIAWSTGKFAKASDSSVHPSGYALFEKFNKKDVSKTCVELDVDAIISIRIEYSKKIWNGAENNGSMKAGALVEMTVIDRTGKVVWSERAGKYSVNQFPVVMGVFDRKKFNKALVSATEEASRELFMKFAGTLNGAE